MNAKTYLKQLAKLDRLIENKMIEKARWRDVALGVVNRSEGERVQSSGSQQKMADALDKSVDIEREIAQKIDELIDKRQEVISTIEQLNAVEYDLLHKVYVQYLTLKDVAHAYDRSDSWANYIHGQALKHVQNILDKRTV